MMNYTKIPFSQITDVEAYVEEKLKLGHIIIQILVNEDQKEIDELISYANDNECKSYYCSLTDSDEQLRTSVIVERLEPYYAFKDKDSDDSTNDIDIQIDSQNVTGFNDLRKNFRDMEKIYSGKSIETDIGNAHYEFYISKGKGDIANFGGNIEIEFVTEWMKEQGYYRK